MNKALDDPHLRTKFAANGAFVRHMTPEELAAFVQGEQKTWRPILEAIASEVPK
jgi:tripartite-type tricarboxylate transporter receptor subunit TctC